MSAEIDTTSGKQRLRDVIIHWLRGEQMQVTQALFTMIISFYGRGDILIIFMDRLQIYNVLSPNSVNVVPPIPINSAKGDINDSNVNIKHNPFTFRCSVVSREHHTNDILFIGGFNEKNGVAVNDCQLYSVDVNAFYAISPCQHPRSDARSAMLNKYELVTMGGHQVEAINTAELYSFKENRWTNLPTMPVHNVGFAAASSPNSGNVFMAGGQDSYGVHNTLYALQRCSENMDVNDTSEWQWVKLQNMLRYNYGCDGLYWKTHDKFLVVGGLRRTKNIDQYDVVKDTWQQLPPSTYDHHMGVCSIWNNYVVWCGDDRKICHVELFDHRSNAWISNPIADELQPPYKKARIWKWIP